MQKVTVVDIQHKTFKKILNGYDRAEVDRFLDEIIETLEDEAQARAALEAELADLRERISHFKSMEESLHKTLILAQRTADEVKASAHKEADLIRAEARVGVEKEIARYGDKAEEARREQQRAVEAAERAKGEIRSVLLMHLSLLDRNAPGVTGAVPASTPAAGPELASVAAAKPVITVNGSSTILTNV
jgi:cell division initiation protein